MENEKEKTEETTVAAGEEGASELETPVWSVITFDEVTASGLTYEKATEKLEELKAEKVSGLCVITDEAAARMAKRADKK